MVLRSIELKVCHWCRAPIGVDRTDNRVEETADGQHREWHSECWSLEQSRRDRLKVPEEHDLVNHPPHYTSHPSGIECIEVTEHMGFNLGNAVKYIWRADEKGNAITDLEKARWYIDREIAKRRKLLCHCGLPRDHAGAHSPF